MFNFLKWLYSHNRPLWIMMYAALLLGLCIFGAIFGTVFLIAEGYPIIPFVGWIIIPGFLAYLQYVRTDGKD